MNRSSSPITHRGVLAISLPIVISNATVPLLGAVDTGVVGQMGEAAPIGAVGIGAIILSAVYWIFGFLRMGTAGMAAQAFGADDAPEAIALLIRALVIGGLGGLAIVILQVPIFWGAFQLTPASEEVEGLARSYLSIRVWSAPAAIAIYGITGWLIAQARTRAVLLLQLWMNGLNIVLDLIFVLGFGWGVEGVAVATFIAEWSALLLGLWVVRHAFMGEDWRNWSLIFEAERMFKVMSANADIMIRSVILQIGFVSFLFLGSSFDDVTLAANQILLQFLYITSYAMDGFAISAETLVGQAIGAKRKQNYREAVKLTSIWGVISACVYALVFAIFGAMIIDVMSTSSDVQLASRSYLFWMILAPLTGCAAWMLDGIFIGAVRTKEMRNMMIVSFAVYVAAVAILMPMFGNHGLWAALIIFFLIRGLTLALVFPRIEKAIA